MSERLKQSKQVSNEEVIDDLTKNLTSSLNTAENSAEIVINPSSSSEDTTKEDAFIAELTGELKTCIPYCNDTLINYCVWA